MAENKALVLVSDLNYLEYTKQVFYSANTYGNWKGDMVLLACGIPGTELDWFKKRNITILSPEPIIPHKVNGWPPVVFHKFYLLHPLMQKWERLLYLDADTIVLRDINKITEVQGFAACDENGKLDIRGQFLDEEKLTLEGKRLIENLGRKHKLSKTAFNVGVMVLDTKQNSMELFNQAKSLLLKYEHTLYLPEQALFNLIFYKKWKKIPQVYNDFFFYKIADIERYEHLKFVKSQSKILHFIGEFKPWDKKCFYHEKWKENFERSELLPEVAQIGEVTNIWMDFKRLTHRFRLLVQMYAGHLSWLSGQKLQKLSPPAYFFLKRFLP